MPIPPSALAHHLSVLDEGDEEIMDLSDEMRRALFAVTEAARRAEEDASTARAERVAELTGDLDCDLDLPTALDLAAILTEDIEAAREREDEDLSGIPLGDLETLTFDLEGADPVDEESAAQIDGAIEALLFAMKGLYS